VIAPDLSRAPDLTTTIDGGAAISGCPAGAIFCDDFETGDLSRWPNPVTNCKAGTVEGVDGTRAFRGARSLHATEPNTGVSGGCDLSLPINPVSSGVLAVRFYVYSPALLRGDWTGLLYFDDGAYVALGDNTMPGQWKIYWAADYYGIGVQETPGAWQCVEEVLDVTNSRIELFVDDAANPNPSKAPIVTLPNVGVGTISTIDFGLMNTPGGLAEDVSFDDVAVANHRIGCE